MYALKQRVHPTWMLTALCVSLVAGVGAARYVAFAPSAFAVVGCAGIAMAFFYRRAWAFGLIIAGGIMFGLWRGGVELQGLGAYHYVLGKTVLLTGVISADPQPASKGGQAAALSQITIASTHLPGTVYVTLGDEPGLRRDDMVTVKGIVTASYGTYAATLYDVTVTSLKRSDNLALDFRDTFNGAVKQSITEPAASLGIGILVGQKTALPSDFSDALKIAGLTHIVVASGYNLTILVRFARRIFSKISRFQAAAWGVALILGFMAITGWSASMTRAGLVAGLSLWAWYYGRKMHPVTLLAFAACVTVIVYPPYAWNDIGWALSFAAFAGVIILSPLLHAYFYGATKPGLIGQIILETLSAQIATLPIMLGVFGQLSIVALLSNCMILPLISVAMALTFVAGMGQLLIPALGAVLAWPAQTLLNYVVWAVQWTASFPWAQITWQMPAWGVATCYMAMVAVCYYLSKVTQYKLRMVNVVE